MTLAAKCPRCQTYTYEYRTYDYFYYGTGPDATELYAMVPVIGCRHCDLEWTDHRGEDARQAVVDKHLQGLPEEKDRWRPFREKLRRKIDKINDECAVIDGKVADVADLYINHESMKFSINARELQTLAEWQAEHDKSCNVECYRFHTANGIGTAVSVSCSCGESKNITDYGSW